MRRLSAIRSVTARALAVASVAAVVAVVAPSGITAPVGIVAAAPGLGAGGEYHPVTPQRIYDSRPSSPVNEPFPGPKPAGPGEPTFDIQVTGLGGVPTNPKDVLGVVASIVVTEPTAEGWLNAYSAGSNAGTSAVLTFLPGRTVPNLSIVVPDSTLGRLTVKLFAVVPANAHVIVDVFGWYSTSTSSDCTGSRLEAISPGRLYDAGTAVFGAGESRILQGHGASLNNGLSIPTNATAVVLNIASDRTMSTTGGESYVSAVPNRPIGAPGTANLNVYPGQTKANAVMVPLGADGNFWLYNNAGLARLVVDVLGWYVPGNCDPSARGRVVPLSVPFRLWDTRDPAWGSAPLGAGQAEDWGFGAFTSSVSVGGATGPQQLAVIGNLTAASLTRQYFSVPVFSSYMSAWAPDPGVSQPLSAVLNVPEGFEPTPNFSILSYSALKTVRFYNNTGSVQYVFDATAVVLGD
jgi:hypothetical protein